MNGTVENLAQKIETLSSEQIAEVEHFVDFLRVRAQRRVINQRCAPRSPPCSDNL